MPELVKLSPIFEGVLEEMSDSPERRVNEPAALGGIDPQDGRADL